MRALMGTFLALMLALTAGCGDNRDNAGNAATSSAGTEKSGAPKSSADQNKKYAECIRAHGVPDFPDPGPDGKFSGDGAKNLDRTKLMSAMQACQDLAAGTEIGQATTTMTTEQVEQFRAYAKCMRDHGVDLPDPGPNDSVLSWAQSWQSKVDTDAPTFKSAAEACQKQLGGLR